MLAAWTNISQDCGDDVIMLSLSRAVTDLILGAHSHRVLGGVGHNVPQETPDAFVDAVLEVGGAR